MVASESLASLGLRLIWAKKALDDSAAWQNQEADVIGDLLDDGDGNRMSASDALGVLGAVGEGGLDERE